MSRADLLARKFQRALRRDFWLTVLPVVVVCVLAFALAFHFVEPAPPKTIVLAAGRDEGGFRFYAKKYEKILAKDGIKLEVRETDGSVENLKLLSDPASGVDVAFVQGGMTVGEEASQLVSLGSLSYVPLWIFYRGEPVEDLRGFAGKRISIGPDDSGTHALALTLLKANKVADAPTELLKFGRKEAIEKLEKGELDVAFFVAPAESPAIKKLAAVPGVRLLGLARAEAYTRIYPYLSRLVLPRGVFDLAADVPERDVPVVAPTANLIARPTLHPALSYLLLRAATEAHGSAGLLDRAGEFPAALDGGFPLSDEARRYYKSGSPLLQRFLPFWAANLVDRLWVMLVPIIAIIVPLVRLVPPLYRWRVRSRIYRWYARLKEVELQLDEATPETDYEPLLARLEEIERAVNHIPTPLSQTENLYSFRQNLDLVRRRITQRLVRPAPKPATAA